MPEICDDILLLPVGNYSLIFFLVFAVVTLKGRVLKTPLDPKVYLNMVQNRCHRKTVKL